MEDLGQSCSWRFSAPKVFNLNGDREKLIVRPSSSPLRFPPLFVLLVLVLLPFVLLFLLLLLLVFLLLLTGASLATASSLVFGVAPTSNVFEQRALSETNQPTTNETWVLGHPGELKTPTTYIYSEWRDYIAQGPPSLVCVLFLICLYISGFCTIYFLKPL